MKKPKIPTSVTDLVPDTNNANLGSERGLGVLETSLRDLGAGRSIVIDNEGNIIAGNKTVEAAVNAGLLKLRVVQTRGDEIVAVQRLDLNLKRDARAKKLAIADNRAGELSLSWNPEVLKGLYDEGIELAEIGFSPSELEELTRIGSGVAPEDFDALDSIETNHKCPRCNFKWKEGRSTGTPKKKRKKLRDEA